PLFMILNFLKSGYQKIKRAFAKTGAMLGNKIRQLFKGKIDETVLEQLEQVFYEADLGVTTAMELTEKIRAAYQRNPALTADDLITEVRQDVTALLSRFPPELKEVSNLPMVILIVGVNGNGKTTSVAKLAKRLQDSGKKVLVAAADTFRAAAIEQLETWA